MNVRPSDATVGVQESPHLDVREELSSSEGEGFEEVRAVLGRVDGEVEEDGMSGGVWGTRRRIISRVLIWAKSESLSDARREEEVLEEEVDEGVELKVP